MTVRPADEHSSPSAASSRASGRASAPLLHVLRNLLWRSALGLCVAPLIAAGLAAGACGSDDGAAPDQPGDQGDGGTLPDGQTPVDNVCSTDGWCWDLPFPQGNDITSVFAFSADDAWFVGVHGTIVHYQGGHWQAASSPTTRDLRGVWASGPKDIWAVGAHANVVHYDGTSWKLVNGTAADPEPLDAGADAAETGPDAASKPDAADAGEAGPPGLPDDRDLLAIDGRSANDIWVVGAAGTIAHYDGDAWIAEEGVTKGILRTVWAGPSDTVMVAGDNVVFTYDGEAWAKVEPGVARAWYTISASGADDIWMAGSANTIAHYDGKVWTNEKLVGNVLRTVLADRADSVWAFGDQGTAWHWDGEAWLTVSTGTRSTLSAASRYASGKFFVAGAEGAILLWENGARSSLIRAVESNFLGIAASASNDIWVVGDTVLHGDSESWNETAPPVNRSLFGIWTGSETNVWAVGTGGTILGRSPIGWVVNESPTTEWLRSVWGTTGGAGWIVGDKGTVLGLLNGASWAAVPSGTTSDLYAVWGPSVAEAWAVGDKGTILHWAQGKWQRKDVEATDSGAVFRSTLHAVWGTGSTDVWAVGSLGAILHYNGTVWRVALEGGDETLNAVWGRSTTDVWAAGTSGKVLHYDGTGWARSESGTVVDLRAIWGSDDGTTWIVGDHGAILRRSKH